MVLLVVFYFASIFMTIVAGYSPADVGMQLIYFAPGMGAGTILSIQMISKLRQVHLATILLVLSQ
jgi:hypothetical protein